MHGRKQNRRVFPWGVITAFGLCLAAPAGAEVKMSGIFGNGMVLQQEVPLPVWGWAEPDESVTVQLDRDKQETKADANGNWKVTLPAREADGKAHTLTVGGTKPIIFTDIQIGEVWIGSGQSNMKKGAGKAAKDQPLIRLYQVPNSSGKWQKDVAGSWEVCGPKTGARFSAVMYGFGVRLREDIDVPVGLIHASWNSSWIHGWYVGGPEYKGMIHPLVPYALRGVLWYQGEANTGHAGKDPLSYYKGMKKLIEGWREAWDTEFPFYFVQIAPFKGHRAGALPLTWHSQVAALKLPRTGMAVTTDLSDINNIHGIRHTEVGRRLALWALAKDYGEDLVYSGPVYKGMKVERKQIRISFAHVGAGLASRDKKPLTHFEIAGADGAFVPAEARIDSAKQTVLVRADDVAKPAHVRFGWSKTAQPNLMNKAKLPASPFTTENWQGGTAESAEPKRRPTAPVQSKQVAADVPFDEDREPRTWSAKSGSTLEAKLLRARGSRVELETPDGRKMQIKLRSLSAADREYVQSLGE